MGKRARKRSRGKARLRAKLQARLAQAPEAIDTARPAPRSKFAAVSADVLDRLLVRELIDVMDHWAGKRFAEGAQDLTLWNEGGLRAQNYERGGNGGQGANPYGPGQGGLSEGLTGKARDYTVAVAAMNQHDGVNQRRQVISSVMHAVCVRGIKPADLDHATGLESGWAMARLREGLDIYGRLHGERFFMEVPPEQRAKFRGKHRGDEHNQQGIRGTGELPGHERRGTRAPAGEDPERSGTPVGPDPRLGPDPGGVECLAA